MNFDFGDVLTRAWQITWKNKVLWGISVLPNLVFFPVLPIWLYFVFGVGFDPNQLDRLFANPAFVTIGIIVYLGTMMVTYLRITRSTPVSYQLIFQAATAYAVPHN